MFLININAILYCFLFPVFVHYFSPFSDDLFGETRKIVAGQQVILFYEQSSC